MYHQTLIYACTKKALPGRERCNVADLPLFLLQIVYLSGNCLTIIDLV